MSTGDMTLEQEFELFFDASYSTQKVSSDQKSEMKMIFISGALVASRPWPDRNKYYEESQKLIVSYIGVRLNEMGILPKLDII